MHTRTCGSKHACSSGWFTRVGSLRTKSRSMSASPKAHACTLAKVSTDSLVSAAGRGGGVLTLCMESMLIDTAAAWAWASAELGAGCISPDISRLLAQ